MEHTKTPYQRITINGGVTIVDKYGSMVAKMNRMYDNNSDTANDIVKACNNYNAVVEALQGLKDAFIHTAGNTRGNKAKTDMIKYNQHDVPAALTAARYALEQAE